MRPDWLDKPLAVPSEEHRAEAARHQGVLTKPPGALGVLERIAVDFAGWQRKKLPELTKTKIVVFAADHGVVVNGVSAFPQSVTVEMVKNFSRGGAAITVLAQELDALFEVVDVGCVTDPGLLDRVVSERVGAGTADMMTGAAMTHEELWAAFNVGRNAVLRGADDEVQLLIGGEMGIGNTTAAAAVGSVLTGISPALMTGPGTGLDNAGVITKATVITKAIEINRPDPKDPLDVLRKVGGFELAALAGFYITASQLGVPFLVDGFITSSAALAAVRFQPQVRDWMLSAHLSEEPGHSALLAALGSDALFDLEMRLGEGSGAAVAVPLLQMACRLHGKMAIFTEAGVSEG